jgi:ketosteroid isomerase-like protein
MDLSIGDDSVHNLPDARESCDHLNVKILIALIVLPLSLLALAADCPKNQPKTEAALLELEQNWAAALDRHNADTVACMVADEFEDADVDGSLHTRSQMLAHIPQRKPGSNHLTEMRAHVEGNFGFVRGLNEILDPSGKVVAQVRFTDIFTYRDERWQALAGQETLLREASR